MGRNSTKSASRPVATANLINISPTDAQFLSGKELTKQLGNTKIFSPEVANLFANTESSKIFNRSDIKLMMKNLQLNPSNIQHRKIFAALYRVSNKIDEASAVFDDDRNFLFSSGNHDGVTINKSTEVYPNFSSKQIKVQNVFFNVDDKNNKTPYVGYAMLRQQVWAARKLSEITKKDVLLGVNAISSKKRFGSNQEGEYSGVHVWPKIGYNFLLSNYRSNQNEKYLVREVRARGFKSKDTASLMTEKNPSGKLGIDEWKDIVNTAFKKIPENRFDKGFSLYGFMNVSEDKNPGLQVMQNYGRRSGLIKGGSQISSTGIMLTPEDDATLRSLWLQFGKK